MTVAELITALRAMPQDMPVGYVNDCADNGREFIEFHPSDIQVRAGSYWRTNGDSCKYPTAGVVVLG